MSDLEFVAIQPITHKLKSETETSIKYQLARSALQIMDKFQALHPEYSGIYSHYLAGNGSLIQEYGEDWAANIERLAQQELFMGDEFIGQVGKKDFFDSFVPQFQRLFIGGDFTNLRNLFNKVTLSVHFLGQCSDITLFYENRYFEFLFYQIVSIIYGSLWFPVADGCEKPSVQSDDVSTSMKWTQVERKCRAYYEKSCHFFNGSNEASLEIQARVENELRFEKLVRWYCALAKFKENRFTEFCVDFESLQNDMDLVKTVRLDSQAILFYEIASIACKPFRDLSFRSNEIVLDLCTGNTRIEAQFYEVLLQLSIAQFFEVKSLWTPSLLAHLDNEISYGLPVKTKGTFWDYLVSIIDLKTFLLILSVSECIPRELMIDKLGYKGESEQTRAFVSDNLIMSLAVLGFGDSNVHFDREKDVFYNLPLKDEERESALADTIETIDHNARADAAAAHIKTLLIRKYFT